MIIDKSKDGRTWFWWTNFSSSIDSRLLLIESSFRLKWIFKLSKWICKLHNWICKSINVTSRCQILILKNQRGFELSERALSHERSSRASRRLKNRQFPIPRPSSYYLISISCHENIPTNLDSWQSPWDSIRRQTVSLTCLSKRGMPKQQSRSTQSSSS